MNSAQIVIEKFGGIRPAARAIGIDPSVIHRWRKAKKIPLHNVESILVASKKKRVKIKVSELVRGHRGYGEK